MTSFQSNVAALSQDIHKRNIAYGFKGEDEQRDPTQVTMLVISELAEAFEELRNDYGTSYVYFSCKPCKADVHIQPDGLNYHPDFTYVFQCPTCGGPLKPEGFAVEYADAMIRLLDAGPELGINYDYLIPLKMAFNNTREPKHGKTM